MAAVRFVIADILDAFQRFGVDPRVTKHMLTTPPADMYYFSDFEKGDYRINRGEEPKPVAVAKADTTPRSFPGIFKLSATLGLPPSWSCVSNSDW